MNSQFEPAAQKELLEATAWYLAEGGPATAEPFELAVNRALHLLAVMPRLGSPIEDGLRVWHLRHFPYSLVYRIHEEVLTVLAVAHQSREPGYWRLDRPASK